MNRTPFQGISNIIRFNPIMFIVAGVAIVLGVIGVIVTSGWLSIAICLCLLGSIVSLTLSLAASYWIYDGSSIYDLTFLDDSEDSEQNFWVNINAGFDEISRSIEMRFPETKLHILDFYDPEKHTEASIARARNAYPPHPDTVTIQSDALPIENATANKVIAFFSLHEIRDHGERVQALKEIHRKLKDEGELYLTEHLRDVPNLIVYSFGAFHFHTRKEWLAAFNESGFKIKMAEKTTPFVTTFTLIKA